MRKPLVRLTRQGVPFTFELEEIKVYKVLKAAMAKGPILRKWCPELPIKVKINASNGITNGVLFQQ